MAKKTLIKRVLKYAPAESCQQLRQNLAEPCFFPLKEEREKREAAKRTCCQCGRQISEGEWFVRVSIFDSDEYNTYCASCFIKESNLSEIIRIVAGSKTPPEDFDA